MNRRKHKHVHYNGGLLLSHCEEENWCTVEWRGNFSVSVLGAVQVFSR